MAMNIRLTRRPLFPLILISVGGIVSLHVSSTWAQIPGPPNDPALNAAAGLQDAAQDGDPLLRGPVHEAFAEPYTADPEPGLVIAKEPPAPIEELPPDARPEGDDVEWIPGYWGWDAELEDFVWVSGIWRSPPPNHRWVPGYWFQTNDGYQWVAGTWLRETVQEIEYLAEAPPQTLERGPVGDPPGDNYFWIPGCWTWGGTNYLWRPGYWSVGYSNWMWVPARYYWTPYGYAYCRGYWDYPFVSRGYLFAPYYFPRPTYLVAGFRFTPTISLSVGLITNHFWVATGYRHYFFGDYYSNYDRYGFQPWHRYHYSRRGYDPIFVYHQQHHHHRNGDWRDRDGRSSYYQFVNNRFEQRLENKDFRPPHTWSEQITRLRDNDGRDRDRTRPDFRDLDGDRFENALGHSWKDIVADGRRGDGDRKETTSFTRLSDAQRDQLRKQADTYRDLSERRRTTEAKRDVSPGSDGKEAARGNRIVGDAGDGIQNRFRLPTPDGTTRPGRDFGQTRDGSRPDADRSQGTGDISSSIRSNNELKERVRDRTAQPGANRQGPQSLGRAGRDDSDDGVGTRSQAFEDAIEKARRQRDEAIRSRTGGRIPESRDAGPGSDSGLRSQFDRSQPERSRLDRSQFDRTPSGRSRGEAFSPGGSGTPGKSFAPPASRQGPVPGARNSVPNTNVQDALERARRASPSRDNVTPPGSGARTFTPPAGSSRTFSPPSERAKSFSPPSGGTRSFTPPGAGSSDRGSLQRDSRGRGGDSGPDFRRGSSLSPGSQGSPAFRSGTPGSNVFGTSPSRGRSPVSASPSFGGTRSGNTGPAIRSVSPPSRDGSIPSITRSEGSSSRSTSGFRGPTRSDGGDSDNSSRSRKKRD